MYTIGPINYAPPVIVGVVVVSAVVAVPVSSTSSTTSACSIVRSLGQL